MKMRMKERKQCYKKGSGLNKERAEKETRGKTSSEYEINFLEKRSSWKSLSPGAAFNFHLPSRFSFRSPWPLQYDLVNYTNLLFSAFQFRGRFTRSKVRIVRDPPSKASFLRCDLCFAPLSCKTDGLPHVEHEGENCVS